MKSWVFERLVFLYLWPVNFIWGKIFKDTLEKSAGSGALGLYVITALIIPPIFWISTIAIFAFLTVKLMG